MLTGLGSVLDDVDLRWDVFRLDYVALVYRLCKCEKNASEIELLCIHLE